MATVRPKGAAIGRSGAPLAIQLRRAALEGRLIWRCPDTFALLQAPTGGGPAKREDQRDATLLRLLDRYWDLLIFMLPALLAVGLAAGLALVPAARIAALLIAVCVMLAGGSAVLVVVVRGFVWLYRVLILGRAQDLGEHAVDQLRGLHWSMPLLHVGRDVEVAEILSAVSGHVTGIVHHSSDDVAAGRPGEDGQRDVVLCLEHGVTTEPTREAVRATAGVTPLPGHPVLVVALGRDQLLRHLPNSPRVAAGAIPLLLITIAIVLGFNAQMIAQVERADCAPNSCAGRPASYGDALYWLLNRVLGGDPEGLAAGSLQARSTGLLTTVMGLVVIGWVIASVLRRAAERVVASGPELGRSYNLDATRDVSSEHTGNGSSTATVPAVKEGVKAATEPIALAEDRPGTVHDLEVPPDDGRRGELIDGMLLVAPVPGWSHQEMAGSAYCLLRVACPPELRVLLAPFAVRTPVLNEVQPDVLVARYEDLTEACLPVAPVLVVEVLSPSTQLGDRNTKKAHYARLGVPSYWLLDPVAPGGLEVYELDDGHYQLTAAFSGDEVYVAQRPFPVPVCPARLLDGLRPASVP